MIEMKLKIAEMKYAEFRFSDFDENQDLRCLDFYRN